MHELHMQSVGGLTKMPFRTMMTTVPPGQVTTTGSFGPWRKMVPGFYAARRDLHLADLGVFKGISGILTAHGSYSGKLERIDVHGETDTPNFMLKVSGHTVPFKTTYHAIVDATNGDTTLERINATFLKTSLVAKGGVYDVEGVHGRLVTLDIDMPSGRLEDIMAVKTSQPPMTGGLRLRTKFDLPPGDADVVDKLELDGVGSFLCNRSATCLICGLVIRRFCLIRHSPEVCGRGQVASYRERFGARRDAPLHRLARIERTGVPACLRRCFRRAELRD
jgi:hypothetical protein